MCPPAGRVAAATALAVCALLGPRVAGAGTGADPFDPQGIDPPSDQCTLRDPSPAPADMTVPDEALAADDRCGTTDPQAASGHQTYNAVQPPGDTEAFPPGGEQMVAEDGDATASDPASGNQESSNAPDTDPRTINGVYALNVEDCSDDTFELYAHNPDLDGFSLRAAWSDVEPLEAAYDWSRFDPALACAASHGKKIMLRIIPGVRAPEWVYEAGAARFDFVDDNPEHPTYGQVVSMPLPWDPVFLEKWFDLVAVFGARYADDPAVTIVAITGPATGGEMHLGDKNNPDRWHALGYSNELLIATWELTVDAFVAAFPHQHGSVAIANPVWFDNPHEVRETVGAYCAQVGGGVQGNWLSAATLPESPLYQQVASQAAITPVGFQMLCSAQQERFGGPLSTAIDLGLDAGASFLEFYRPDITAFPDDIAFAHQQLNLTAVE